LGAIIRPGVPAVIVATPQWQALFLVLASRKDQNQDYPERGRCFSVTVLIRSPGAAVPFRVVVGFARRLDDGENTTAEARSFIASETAGTVSAPYKGPVAVPPPSSARTTWPNTVSGRDPWSRIAEWKSRIS
jgi:hypothetical protein